MKEEEFYKILLSFNNLNNKRVTYIKDCYIDKSFDEELVASVKCIYEDKELFTFRNILIDNSIEKTFEELFKRIIVEAMKGGFFNIV